MKDVAKQIEARFAELGKKVPAEEIEKRLVILTEKFKVPKEEARRSVTAYFMKELNLHRTNPFTSPASIVKVNEITRSGDRVDVKARVVQLWENSSDRISQAGRIGDETGMIKFVNWAKSDLPKVEEGKTYLFKNVITDEYQGKFGIKLNKMSKIIPVNEDIDVPGVPSGETSDVKVSDINTEATWVNIKAKVVQLWDNNNPDTISQVGLVGDETGTVKFVSWAKSDLPKVEEGKTYLFKNAVTDKYQDNFSIKLNKNSKIVPIEEEINVTGTTVDVKVSDIAQEGSWVNIKAKVVQLWDNNNPDTISQVGLVGDETGTIKFVNWVKSNLPKVEEGKTYLFKSAVTDKYQDNFSIKLNKNSKIIPIDEDIEIGRARVEMSGVIVDVQNGSGLIKRCPECNRALVKGTCAEHGRVEGIYDLRIKAVVDDGIKVQDILLNREITEKLTGISIEKAREMATEALDQSVVVDVMKSKIIGKYCTVTGAKLDRTMLVESIILAPPVTEAQIKEIMAEAEAV